MNDEQKQYERAQRRVRRIRTFYSTLITYVLVNLLLLVINLVTNPRHLWFYWVTLIWGIVLVIQAINTFTIKDRFLGDDWEEKKIDELLRKDKTNDKK